MLCRAIKPVCLYAKCSVSSWPQLEVQKINHSDVPYLRPKKWRCVKFLPGFQNKLGTRIPTHFSPLKRVNPHPRSTLLYMYWSGDSTVEHTHVMDGNAVQSISVNCIELRLQWPALKAAMSSNGCTLGGRYGNEYKVLDIIYSIDRYHALCRTIAAVEP
jgi:hypothetical protein